MKQIFKLKGKLHKLVNILFYLIFFILGYIIGGGVEIEKIIDSINNIL